MLLYNGIELNEGKLLANNIVFTLILVFLIVMCVIAFLVYRNRENPKSKERRIRLKSKAQTDPDAQKQYEKLERKRKKRNKDDIADKLLVFSLLTILIVINLFAAVIPGWVDYIKKDYIVYGGDTTVEYEVRRYIRSSTITLEVGTVLSGVFCLDEGTHGNTIVYSRRTKIVVGIEYNQEERV